MKTVYLDTETTGLTPGRICQLSYIIDEDEKITAKNFFFPVDYVEPGALKVHGLSPEKLRILSIGTFDDYKFDLLNDLSRAYIICHNSDFDIAFLKKEFHLSKKIFTPEKIFCTMKYFTDIIQLPGNYGSYKWPRVDELMKYMGVTQREVKEYAHRLFGKSEITNHDSRFDVTAVCLCWIKYKTRQQIIFKKEWLS